MRLDASPLLDRRVDCLSVTSLTFSLAFSSIRHNIRQVKCSIWWSYQSSTVLAILQIMIPVCLMICGPGSAQDLATEHDLPPNATRCPAHPDSHDSQDSQFPDRAPSCERTHIGVVLTSSSTYISDSQNLKLVVRHLTLVELNVFALPHSSTLLTHVLRSSIPPLAGTLRL